MRKSNPSIFKDGWSPPSSYASLHEQGLKRKRTVSLFFASGLTANNDKSRLERDISLTNALKKQKKVVILVNEGTASSAEVFASALHDNGRTVAVVGAKTFGKGLIQVRPRVAPVNNLLCDHV